MRALFLAVLLANLLLFGWYYRQAGPPASGSRGRVALHTDVPRLQKINPGAQAVYPEQRAPAGASAVPVVAPKKTPPAGAGPAPAECLSVGPYDTRAAAEADAKRYRQVGLAVGRRRVPEQFKVGQWVYLGPYASRAVAVTHRDRLRAKGIRDLYVVAAPAWRNAVSLGLYSHRKSVERRLRQLRRLGVHPKVRPRFRSRERFWLTVRAAGSSGSLHAAAAVTPGSAHARVARVPCAQIAAPGAQH